MKVEKIPNEIDTPDVFLLWSIDEMIPMATMLVIGILFSQVKVFLIIGVLFTWQLRKYKNLRPDGHMYHCLYWYGFSILNRVMVNPYQREWYS